MLLILPIVTAGRHKLIIALDVQDPSAVDGCSVTAGLSLGEYCALVFAGALTFEEGLKVSLQLAAATSCMLLMHVVIQESGRSRRRSLPSMLGSMDSLQESAGRHPIGLPVTVCMWLQNPWWTLPLLACTCCDELKWTNNGTVCQVVKVRGESMAAAAKQGKPHGMLSIIGLDDAKLESICTEGRGKLGPGLVCQLANYLFPAGRVVSGHKDALEEASPQQLSVCHSMQSNTPCDIMRILHGLVTAVTLQLHSIRHEPAVLLPVSMPSAQCYTVLHCQPLPSCSYSAPVHSLVSSHQIV